jgi:hypothetical protein
MKIQEFLEHHGIAGNPFAEEDAQNDTVFKRTCLESTFHPAWDKIYGDPADPSTAIVFGEKGAGKTALKLQMVRQFDRHNETHPESKTLVVLYDDFNPFLDRFVSRVGPNRPVDKVLSQWKLWDHMDAILSLGVTQFVSTLVDPPAREVAARPKLTPPQARDLSLLAACYDQSTAETFPSRWRKLRSRVGYRAWQGLWPTLVGVAAAIIMGLALLIELPAQFVGVGRGVVAVAASGRRLGTVGVASRPQLVAGHADRAEHANRQPYHGPTGPRAGACAGGGSCRPAGPRLRSQRRPL